MTSRLVVNNIDNDTGVTTIRLNPTYASFELNSAERLRITSAGKVGINTTDPAQTFTSYATSGYPILANGPSNGIGLGNNGAIVFGNKNLGAYAKGILDATELEFKISGTPKVSITSAGKIGIGTASPSTEVHLYGDAPVLTVTPTNWQSGLRLNVVGLGYHGSNNQLFRVQRDGTTKLQLNEDGDLVITGDDNAELKLKCGTTTGNNVIAFLNSAGSTKGNIFYDSDNNFMVFKTDGTAGDDERLRITSDGDIGINESSPDNMLHVTTTNNTGYSTATSNTQNITNALLKLQNLDGGDGGGVNNYVGIHFAVANGATSHAQLNYVRTGDNSGKFSFKARNGNGSVYPNLMDITSAGYIKTPNQPIFMAYRVSNYDITTTATAMVYTEEKIDVGGNYDTSNGRFTAPVDGIYEFGYASIAKNTTTVYRYDLRINGSIPYSGMRQELRYDQSNNSTQYASNGEFCLYIQMTAGQYAQVYVHSDSAASSAYGDTQYGYTYFRGRLIG